jgi:poly(A) polymerase
MVEPIVIPRSEHTLSRRDIDPDALRVLYRLRDANYVAYLVGGSVRDLLLGRRPKDFDVGTSAHPYQVKRLFRNCWIIGRRFRLAHVKFGTKVIEVATFRRQIPATPEQALNAAEVVAQALPPEGQVVPDPGLAATVRTAARHDLLIHHDNTFGTPEEDAFRRDFTINALFYDIASFSIIDYVGGLQDLGDRVVRAIGEPGERFQEDPVRMLRAIALAAKLDFAIDPPVDAAIRRHRSEIARSATARLVEEYFKILRAGASERTFRWLADVGLLGPMTPELQRGLSSPLWKSLARLDAFRRRFAGTPQSLTNPILLGSLLVPLGFNQRPLQARQPARFTLGVLPLPRRDLERLRQILALQSRMLDASVSPRAAWSLMNRSAFAEALTWLEIHGSAPDAVANWRSLVQQQGEKREEAPAPYRPRRRRRRYRGPVQPQ